MVVIRRLALIITKGSIGQRLHTVVTRATYGALTGERLNIHERNARNFMVSQPHLAKRGVTMEGNKMIMGKHTCLLFNQLKKNP